MSKKIILKNTLNDPIIVYENALLCYVYGRVTLNSDWYIFLLPSIFFHFHHAIEISIKTILILKKIEYPTKGQEGHKLIKLLKLAVNSKLFSDNVNNLIQNNELINLLENMDVSYLDNKYNYPGYQISIPLRKLIDEIIFILFDEINFLLTSKEPKHALARLNIPESVEKVFLYKLEKTFSYTVLKLRKY